MDPPAKYSGDKEKDWTYDAVHQFLSQLSRYLRLATNVDMDADIAEYVFGFLEGFAFRWFDALDKGTDAFRWKDFETAFRTKFIPREHVELSIKKYLAIKQNKWSVVEFIVEREALENTLGKDLSERLKETSFRDNLDKWLQEKLMTFEDLPFEQYKRKAESMDRGMRARKLGPYSEKTNTEVSKSKPNTIAKSTSKGNVKTTTKPGDKKPNDQKSKVNNTDEKRNEPSKNQMRKEGLCFTYKKEGHIARDCPENQKIENNSI
jgi:hypothetical protein